MYGSTVVLALGVIGLFSYRNSSCSGPRGQWNPEGFGTYFGNLSATYNQTASRLANADL